MSLMNSFKKMFGKKSSKRELFNTLYDEYRLEIISYHTALTALGRQLSGAIDTSHSNKWVVGADYMQLNQSILITAANIKGAKDALDKNDLHGAMQLSVMANQRIVQLVNSITTTRDDMGLLLNNIKSLEVLHQNIIESSNVLTQLMD